VIFIYLAVTFISFIFVFKSADIIIRSSVAIADHYGISRVFIGVVLVGLSTSAPEIFVTAIASVLNKPQIIMGNASGSIAANTGIAMALIFWIASGLPSYNERHQKITDKFTAVNFVFLPAGAACMFFVIRNGISRTGGLILLIALAAYLFLSSKASEEFFKVAETSPAARPFAIFFPALAVLLLSSRVVVWSSANMARLLGISEFVIAVTIIAVGTSIPEIATSISATRDGEYGLAVGDIVGSQAFNLYLLPGIAALFGPLKIDNSRFIFGWMFIILAQLLFFIYVRKIPLRLKASVLFATYILYIISDIKIF